jgi:hypothetical protein
VRKKLRAGVKRMYVKDLTENMLVVPAPGSTWQFGYDEEEGPVLKAHGISGHIIMHGCQWPIPGYESLDPTPAMYLCKRRDDWVYGGVFTHHYLLVDGMLCIIDGYQFGKIESLEKKNP